MIDEQISKQHSLASIKTQQYWFKAADLLAQCVATHQAALRPMLGTPWDLDQFAISTQLYQLDRLVVKCREYYLIFRHRQEKLAARNESIYRIDLMNAQDACLSCYHLTVKLYALLKNAYQKKINSQMFMNQIHRLELHTITLCNAIRKLNQLVERYEISHLSQFEQDLIQALLDNPRRLSSNPESANETLLLKVKQIADSQSQVLVEEFIQAHDALKRCYVISRKVTVHETLEQMKKDILALLGEFLQAAPQEEKIFENLQKIFQKMESLLFSAKSQNRCAINLFEKAKKALQRLRKACVKHPIGCEYIKKYSLKRTTLLNSQCEG